MSELQGSWKTRTSNYNRFPTISVKGYDQEIFEGYEVIAEELSGRLSGNGVLVLDCYPGVDKQEILSILSFLNPTHVICSEDIFKDKAAVNEILSYFLTEDRVFGRMYHGELSDFTDPVSLATAKAQVLQYSQGENPGLTVIYGVGSSLITRGDCLVCLDLARWEIQLRFRNGLGNFLGDNESEEILKKFKRGYFFEWRVADKHKHNLIEHMGYLLDTNRQGNPVMVSGDGLRAGLKEAAKRPFRTVPYFDPGVWGGQWMKQVCGLDPESKNYAWSFDGVPEENSLLLKFGDKVVEIPAMDLILYRPKALLGEQVYARFGAEFPIRFDFLDTMDGGNLSLQVHPLTDYVRKQFGMAYTQDESYYILDAREDAEVYLGLKENMDPDSMIGDLKKAENGEQDFDAKAYINCFPAKKHDHFLIPAGTCHCSGKNAMVLEISATPYIFTFKLWDWGRLSLDGKPRPIHLDHGKHVIQWDRTTAWVKEHLVNAIYPVHQGQDYVEEHTGLHELEFIETRRYWFEKPLELDTRGTVHMMNLVEGESVWIESPEAAFEPFEIHYVETFIIPACVGKFRVRPAGGRVGLIDAYVREW